MSNIAHCQHLESLNQRESELAMKLKTELCYVNGREKLPVQCAKVFQELSLIYKERYQQYPEKIYLIQSVSLLNAALVRKPANLKQTKEDLQTLCLYILQKARAKKAAANLVEQAKKVSAKVFLMRQKACEGLSNLKVIPATAEGDHLHEMELSKISDIKKLQAEITKSYKMIMDELALYCTCVMGEPPCKFALVGMGSLARSEITPYSDFENIIILEEGVQKRSGYEEILEYFRWFAVIFQVVLINLGETIVPSVAIQSLNNFGSSTGDWFYDAYTTRGISFDGLMPHACKSPLGRQTKTTSKPWISELIKPLTEMLRYLDSQQAIREGYHLAEILSNVCYVSGNKALFDKFEKLIEEKLLSEDHQQSVLAHLYSQIKEDLETFGIRKTFYYLSQGEGFNIKSVVYRSTTIFIAALGKLHGITMSTCFDIIEKLGITTKFSHKLLYAVAIACEVRLRIYMTKKSQDDWIEHHKVTNREVGEVIQAIGEKSMMDYIVIAYSLQHEIASHYGFSMKNFYGTPPVMHVSISYYIGRYEEALQSAILLLKGTDKGENNIDTSRLSTFCITDATYDQITRHMDVLKNSKSTLIIPNTISANISEKDVVDILKHIGVALQKMNKHDEALEQTQRELMLRKKLGVDEYSARNIGETLNLIATCMNSLGRYGESVEMNKKSLESIKKTFYKDKNKDMVILYSCIGYSLSRMKNYEEAIIELKKGLRLANNLSPNRYTLREISKLHYRIGLNLQFLEKYEKALPEFEQALDIRKRLSTAVDWDNALATILYCMAVCFKHLGNFEAAQEKFEETLNIEKRITSHESSDSYLKYSLKEVGRYLRNHSRNEETFENSYHPSKCIEMTQESNHESCNYFYNIGHCLEKVEKYKDALKHFSKALTIQKQLSPYDNSSNCDEIARFLSRIDICTRNLNRQEEVLQQYQSSLDIIKNYTSVDTRINKEIAIRFSDVGFCLKCMARYDEALEYFQKALEIRKRISSDESIDSDVGHSLNKLGICLFNLNRHEEALVYYQRSLRIRQRVSQCDHDIVAVLNNIALCFKSLVRHKEAMEHFEKAIEIRRKILPNECSSGEDFISCLDATANCMNRLRERDDSNLTLKIKQWAA